MNIEPLLSREELEDAAFYLLTCSSIERYVRMAKRVAAQSGLSDRVSTDPRLIHTLIDYARELWKKILSTTRRDISELELAVLLPILARTGVREVEYLLLALSLVDHTNAAWISGLARRLRLECASNRDLYIGSRLVPKEIVTHNLAASVDTLLLARELCIVYPKNKVSQMDQAFELTV